MVYALLALLVILQALDVYMTHKHLEDGGREGNPFARKMFEKFGFWPTAVGGKVLTTVPMAVAVYLYPDRWEVIAVLAVVCTFYLYVTLNNFQVVYD